MGSHPHHHSPNSRDLPRYVLSVAEILSLNMSKIETKAKEAYFEKSSLIKKQLSEINDGLAKISLLSKENRTTEVNLTSLEILCDTYRVKC